MMRRLALWVCVPVLAWAPLFAQAVDIDQAANQLATRITTDAGVTVAVVDFTDLQGRVTELGRYYSEEFSIALVNASGKLKVIDRGHLKALLVEHKLQSSGLIDEKTAAELGRIAGVTILVTGSVTELADSVRLTVKALDTKTARIQAAASISLPKSPTTMALLRRDVADAGPVASAASAPSSPRPAGASNVRMFQNDFLMVGVSSLSLRKERDQWYAYLSLSVENKSAQDEYLACKAGPYGIGTEVSLMDSQGRDWRCSKVTGLPVTSISSVEGEERRAAGTGKTYLVRLAPGVRQTVLLAFYVSQKGPESLSQGTASFAMEMLRYRESGSPKVERFSVGLSDIPMAGLPAGK